MPYSQQGKGAFAMSEPGNFSSDTQVREFVSQFADRTLPRESWTHAAHITVAVVYLRSLPEESVLGTLRDDICAYNVACGVRNTKTSGYHETLTRFWLRAVQDTLRVTSAELPLHEQANWVCERLSDSRLPLRHWERDALLSPFARANWLEPDKEPLSA